jgi:GAF domain-containing protein
MSNNQDIQDIQQARLAALYEVSSQLGASLDLSQALNQVMDAVIELTGAERGFLLFDEENNRIKTIAARSADQEAFDDQLRQISPVVVGQVVASGESLLIDNVQNDGRFSLVLNCGRLCALHCGCGAK